MSVGGLVTTTARPTSLWGLLADTPIWVPLVAAGIAVVGTIVGTLAGVAITQRHADQREDVAWRREQARWAREDRARTFDHRRAAYSDFYESLREMARRAYDHGMGLSEDAELGLRLDPPRDRRRSRGTDRRRLRLAALRRGFVRRLA